MSETLRVRQVLSGAAPSKELRRAVRSAACGTLDRLDVQRLGDEVVITAAARSFLHHQIRNLAGTLHEVGIGKRPVSWPRTVLEGRDRARAGQTAPPEGLTLTGVRYPDPIDWG